MDCFGTYFTHVQTCNVTRVPGATEAILVQEAAMRPMKGIGVAQVMKPGQIV